MVVMRAGEPNSGGPGRAGARVRVGVKQDCEGALRVSSVSRFRRRFSDRDGRSVKRSAARDSQRCCGPGVGRWPGRASEGESRGASSPRRPRADVSGDNESRGLGAVCTGVEVRVAEEKACDGITGAVRARGPGDGSTPRTADARSQGKFLSRFDRRLSGSTRRGGSRRSTASGRSKRRGWNVETDPVARSVGAKAGDGITEALSGPRSRDSSAPRTAGA